VREAGSGERELRCVESRALIAGKYQCADRGCNACRYCNAAHQKMAWKTGARTQHKNMCPLLRKWREHKKEKISRAEVMKVCVCVLDLRICLRACGAIVASTSTKGLQH
jgi:hypothetical protein